MSELEYGARISRARKKFIAMAATYSLGVFNDNFFKQAVMLTALTAKKEGFQQLAVVVFTLPFILFAAPAGWAADRFSKRAVVIFSKALELAAMICGAVGIVTGTWPLIFLMLFIMALQSTIFGPALNGSIPELYPEEFVIKANARLKVVTTAAILAGIAVAGVALDRAGTGLFGIELGRATVATVIIGVSAVGLLLSFGVPRRPAAAPNAPIPWNGPAKSIATLISTRKDPLLAISIGADAIFWFVASLQVLLLNEMGINQFGFTERLTSCLVAAELAGVVIGGLLSPFLARGRRWYWVLSPAGFQLGAFMVAIGFVPALSGNALVVTLFAFLVMAGMAGGIFTIPLMSFKQVRPPADRKGEVLAAGGFLSFVGIGLSGPVSGLLLRYFEPTTGFAVAGVLMLALSAWLFFMYNWSNARRYAPVQRVVEVWEGASIVAMRLFVKCALSLRYRVRVKGIDEIAERGTTGILFLPNHPAYIDPFPVLSQLNRDFAPRFLADKDQTDRFFVRWLATRAGAIPIPDASRYHGAAAVIERALGKGTEGLRAGENFLFYPAGQATYSRFEDLGGKSALETILRGAPDARVVLVRTRGLWGSMFSRAGGPDINVKECVAKAVRSLLLNGIFFSPRREVTIELVEPADLPRGADRVTLNRYLEDFYNEDAPPSTYVPYTIWETGGIRELPEPPARVKTDAAKVPEAVRAKVTGYLVELTGRASVEDGELLGRDLGLDSLSIVGLVAWLEGEFALRSVEVRSLRSVGDVMSAAAGQTVESGPVELKPIPEEWFEPRPLFPVEGETITQAFLEQAARSPSK
ncbi:MAG: MFS transporter, partial [Planctomycetota bacterium]